MTREPDLQKRLYALMAVMEAADDRLSNGIRTGALLCVYWPSRGATHGTGTDIGAIKA